MEINIENIRYKIMAIKMQNIRYKIMQKKHEEIIRDIESIKNDPGFNINKKVDGSTLLICAVCFNRNKLVEYLLKDPNIDVNYGGHFGLATIFYCRSVSILKLLLDHRNIDVNVQDKDGQTVLHVFCKEIKMIRELLIDGRIDLSIKDKYGKTALDRAMEFKHYDVAKMIIIMSSKKNVLSKDLARRLCEYM